LCTQHTLCHLHMLSPSILYTCWSGARSNVKTRYEQQRQSVT
jgi:hypothetical protein